MCVQWLSIDDEVDGREYEEETQVGPESAALRVSIRTSATNDSEGYAARVSDFEFVSAIAAHRDLGENIGVGASDIRRGTCPPHG